MNNVFRINNKPLNSDDNSKMNKNNSERVIKMIELFSFWITFNFVIYLLFQNYLPSWTNPTFWLLYGFSAQLALFILGKNIMATWFKLNVFIWKFGILLLALFLIPYDLSYPAINFNLALFLLYLIILKVFYNTDVVNVYIGSILTKKYHKIQPKKFIVNRLRNII